MKEGVVLPPVVDVSPVVVGVPPSSSNPGSICWAGASLAEASAAAAGAGSAFGAAGSAKTVAKSRIELDGPSGSKGFADKYMASHPDVAKEASKYRGVLNKVKTFKADEDGTFSATTGERLDLTEGFCVTFHQNLKIGDEYGAYDDDTYSKMCAITKHELKSSDVYIGYYGNPEVSFNCPDEKTAMDFAIKHNQKSIYNCKTGKTILNKHYNPETNPIEGDKDG